MQPHIIAVSSKSSHALSKINQDVVTLIQGLGVEGDAHAGVTVKHRSRVARNPNQPNLRQVHLIHSELFSELETKGFKVSPGQMGENITTSGVELLDLPVGTRLRLGQHAVIELTGLRNPCAQLEGLQPGLMAAVLDKNTEGKLIRKAGVMAIVLSGGEVRPGDKIEVQRPELAHQALEPV